MQVNFNLLVCLGKQSFLSHVNKKEETANAWAFFHVGAALWEAGRSHGDVALQPANSRPAKRRKGRPSCGKERKAKATGDLARAS